MCARSAGLAYSVGSGLRASVYDQGVWLMRAETKLSSTQEVVNRFVANMERMRNEPVTDLELGGSQGSLCELVCLFVHQRIKHREPPDGSRI